jgi:hypothetical protein
MGEDGNIILGKDRNNMKDLFVSNIKAVVGTHHHLATTEVSAKMWLCHPPSSNMTFASPG